MKKSIYLSPSTQEHNIGAGKYGSEEAVMNRIADVVENELIKNDFVVYRNKPEWDLKQVVADSNAKKPDIHLAIHSNAGGGRGCEVFAIAPGGQGEKLARAVFDEIDALTPAVDRGIKFSSNLYELTKTKAPAALIEVAFHDNPADAEWILQSIQPIGQAISNGILNYFGVVLQERDTSFKAAVKVLYEKEIIKNPEYWLQNAIKGKAIAGEYAAILIKGVAALVLKGEF
ncbi:MAG: N-acetylmuramoyl-L-alanine amidase family protein [Deltaproteobacteria bacterium]